MLSGIGPEAELRRHGIAVVADRAGVGANLQDHLDVCTLQHETRRTSYDRASELKLAFDYFLRGRRGPGTSNIAEGGAFLRSPLATDDRADVQLHFIPAMIDDHGRNRSEEHTSELQSLMRISYAVFRLKKKKHVKPKTIQTKTLHKSYN